MGKEADVRHMAIRSQRRRRLVALAKWRTEVADRLRTSSKVRLAYRRRSFMRAMGRWVRARLLALDHALMQQMVVSHRMRYAYRIWALMIAHKFKATNEVANLWRSRTWMNVPCHLTTAFLSGTTSDVV